MTANEPNQKNIRITIKVLAIIAIVVGAITILSIPTQGDPEAAFIGGIFFIGYGICTLVYLGQENKSKGGEFINQK